MGANTPRGGLRRETFLEEGARLGPVMFQLRPPKPPPNPRVNSSHVQRRDTPKPVVLVIDDGAEARDLYCAYLEFHGFTAEAADDGPTGIAHALEHRPDAIVLDFSMPRMDGAEVLVHLKADPRTSGIPVVMVTAVPELVDRDTRSACAAFLEKPCEPDTLMDALDDLVGGESPHPVGEASGGRTGL
jgi:CheY-like chemotaxis protein